MKRALAAFLCAFLFGVGLIVGGMTIPANIIGFFDVTGTWRPALIFVMVGAIIVYSIGYRLVTKRKHPVLDGEFHLPQNDPVDAQLITGSALFGIGWGIGGYCPGPAITGAGAGAHDAMILFGFMLAGMFIHQKWQDFKSSK